MNKLIYIFLRSFFEYIKLFSVNKFFRTFFENKNCCNQIVCTKSMKNIKNYGNKISFCIINSDYKILSSYL